MLSGEIQTDFLAEAGRVVDAARASGTVLAGTGGAAIGISCPSARAEPLARSYQDLDFVTTKKQVRQVGKLFVGLGYEPDDQFNSLHGETRLYFLDRVNEREADVFVDAVRGCHELDLIGRLDDRTLHPADLLLSKLQVRETNRKDYQDIFAVLLDHDFTVDDSGISEVRIAEVCGNDWGWWRTVSEVAVQADAFAVEVLSGRPGLDRVRTGLRRVGDVIATAPKSRRWRMRARVGDRMRWYESPEEVAHADR